uniref:Reverse transcriptase zinc-binding domain-containing protein n=1 Tax=Quercus lobata TaxID=97700 RepID=A0A7N2R3U7_QUELO
MVDPRCEICCKKPESVGHILCECPLARNVWAICKGKIHKCPKDAREFFALFRMLVDRLPEMELDRWATISWTLWNVRNKNLPIYIHHNPNLKLISLLSLNIATSLTDSHSHLHLIRPSQTVDARMFKAAIDGNDGFFDEAGGVNLNLRQVTGEGV